MPVCPTQVNGRLAKEEADGGVGDKAFPKAMWPPAELCPACRDPAADNGIDIPPVRMTSPTADHHSCPAAPFPS